MINNFKEQCFSEMIGSEAANKTDNNTVIPKKMELTLEIDSYCSILHSGKKLLSSAVITKKQFR